MIEVGQKVNGVKAYLSDVRVWHIKSGYPEIPKDHLRLKYQSCFDNSSDTADKIWPHIYEEYIKLVEKGELPASDRISLLTFKKRWSHELGEFRLWCAKANRSILWSGVPKTNPVGINVVYGK